MDGNALRAFRRKRGMTQDGLAAFLNERLDRKYDKARVSRWENGGEAVPEGVAEALNSGTGTAARIIVAANQKGGVTKTTSAVMIAAALARRDRRVLLVDADPQGSASVAVGIDVVEAEKRGATLSAVLTEEKSFEEVVQQAAGFDVLPGGISLARFEVQAPTLVAAERRLKMVLDRVRSSYDYIIIDTPPHLGTMTKNALIAATEVLVPVVPAPLDVLGIPLLLETVASIRRYENHGLEILGILPTKYTPRNAVDRAVLDQLRAEFQNRIRVFEPIKAATGFNQANFNGVIALDALPADHPVHAYTAIALEILADEAQDRR